MSEDRKREFRWHRIPAVQYVLYLGLRTLIMIISMFPYSSARSLGRLLGLAIQRVNVKHRKIAALNLERTRFTRDIAGMIRRVYDHFGLSLVEFGMSPRFMAQRTLMRHVRISGTEHVDRVRARGRGVILVIAHLGNWELAGLAAQIAGYHLHSLARPIENRFINRWLLRTRTLTGQNIISKYGALKSMVEVLKRNEILVIQADQDARRAGVLVDFLGRPASTTRSPALIALKYDVAIVPVNIYREGGLHYFVATEPLEPREYRGRPDAVRALTQAYTSRLEEFVRAHPDQWNWLHRRWKSYDRAQITQEEEVEAVGERP